ncbi:hypothetical protein [uncultured Pontibacter sp.]|nr:hypothetical protein [uncultured Pontibacter sp.]
MEVLIIFLIIVLAAVAYLVNAVYIKAKGKKKRNRHYDHYW